MKAKFIIRLFLITSIFQVSAQKKSDLDFSDGEIIMYSQIKKHQLDHPFDIIRSMKENAKLINISEKRMNEILQAQFAGKLISITSIENKELQKLQNLMTKDYIFYTQKTNKLLIEKKISSSRYDKFKKRYHSDPIFQKSTNKKGPN